MARTEALRDSISRSCALMAFNTFLRAATRHSTFERVLFLGDLGPLLGALLARTGVDDLVILAHQVDRLIQVMDVRCGAGHRVDIPDTCGSAPMWAFISKYHWLPFLEE